MVRIADYMNANKNVVLAYVVKNENTLGYLFRNKNGSLYFGILASTPQGYYWFNGPMPVLDGIDKYRKATQSDFDSYRVCSQHHL